VGWAPSALAAYQNRRRRLRCHGDDGHDLLHFRRSSLEPAEHAQVAQFASSNLKLLIAFASVKAVSQLDLQTFGVDRLGKKVEGAKLGSFHGVPNGAETRQHDEIGRTIRFSGAFEQFEAIESGHSQVGNDDGWPS